MGKVLLNDIYLHSVKGVRQSFNKYYKMSGGFGLGQAPESFIQAQVAMTLSKICPFVTLEDTVDGILRDSQSERRGRKPRGSGSGRIDVLIWNDNGTPRVLVEIKKAWKNDVVNNDADRIRKLLNRRGSLQSGLIILYTDAMKSDTVVNRFDTIAGYSNTEIVESIGPNKIIDDETWYWGAACFKVKK